MPLSEQEQRLLDEMERNLYHGESDFARAASRIRSAGRLPVAFGGVVLAAGGAALLIAAVSLDSSVLGILAAVVGFAAMVVGVLLAASGGRASGVPAGPRLNLMDRLAARWERRRQR